MGFYTRTSFRLFGRLSESVSPYFVDVRANLKRARIRLSAQEYLSIAMMTCFLIFLIGLPILSFLFGFVFQAFLFSFISSFTASTFLMVVSFFLILNYPKLIIRSKAKDLDNTLPFASLYLSTIASSKLPLDKTFKIFSKFSRYDEITNEVNLITKDVEMFGVDINTALERAVERTSSKNFKEVLWGVLSTSRAGGDIAIYLKEKAKSFMADYRRKLYEFSHQLTMYIEVYLTTIVLGAIFFTILTAILAGMAGGTGNIIFLQFFLIFIFIPLVSILFVFLIKSITPGGE